MLKLYFIPHEENDHKPHFLRGKTVLVLAALVLLVEAAFLFQSFVVVSHTNFLAAVLPDVLVVQTNENRHEGNLAMLTPNALLQEAAALKANDMAQKGYFAHTSPEGKTPWYWFGQAGYGFVAAGENLAVNFTDSKDVTEAWMNSEGHRANILGKLYTEIGVATARGMYKNREAVFVVQLFGRPAGSAAPKPQEPEESAVEPVVEPVAFASSEARGVEVSGASITVKQIASSPKTVTSYIYGALSVLILLALLLKIFVKIRVQHPRLIASGLLLFILVEVITLANQYLTLVNASILTPAFY